MAGRGSHDDVALYALDALDKHDRVGFERHLVRCRDCRAELVEFSHVTAALALAVESAEPPPELRARILVAARRDS